MTLIKAAPPLPEVNVPYAALEKYKLFSQQYAFALGALPEGTRPPAEVVAEELKKLGFHNWNQIYSAYLAGACYVPTDHEKFEQGGIEVHGDKIAKLASQLIMLLNADTEKHLRSALKEIRLEPRSPGIVEVRLMSTTDNILIRQIDGYYEDTGEGQMTVQLIPPRYPLVLAFIETGNGGPSEEAFTNELTDLAQDNSVPATTKAGAIRKFDEVMGWDSSNESDEELIANFLRNIDEE